MMGGVHETSDYVPQYCASVQKKKAIGAKADVPALQSESKGSLESEHRKR